VEIYISSTPLGGKATALHRVTIDYDKCVYCNTCVSICPWGVYEDTGDQVEVAHMKDCVCCMSCVAPCPVDAITVEEDPAYLNK
jgi:electron transport complex protein RnfB